jgi:outer membrane protein assembly factor BamE (lipoprotein component of BamABCDE complex)
VGKRRIARVAGALLALALVLALALAAAGAAADWRDPASWQQLRVGMSRSDVLRILGEPGKVTRYYAFERWEYPDALGERVNFDERGRLVAWGAVAR